MGVKTEYINSRNGTIEQTERIADFIPAANHPVGLEPELRRGAHLESSPPDSSFSYRLALKFDPVGTVDNANRECCRSWWNLGSVQRVTGHRDVRISERA